MTYKIILSLLVFSYVSKAQESGVVKYEEDVTFNIPEEYKIMMKDAPKSMQANKILAFSGREMSYINGEAKEEEHTKRGGRRGMRFMRGSKENVKYYNFDTGIYLEKANRFRKDFLIKDSITQLKWKISAGEQRDILGYTCMKGIHMRDSTKIEAWFTPQIPVSLGPDGLHGLPGLILAVGYGEDKAILAKEIDLSPIDDSNLQRLESNKDALSREEYNTMMEERQEEMKKMWGGSSKRRKMRGRH